MSPGLVIGSYIIGIQFTDKERRKIIHNSMKPANEGGGPGMYLSCPPPTCPDP